MRIDTHIHSTYSDGRDTVEEIFRLAKRVNLDAIALTDHDTNVGWNEGFEYAEKYGVGFIAGCEISTVYKGMNQHLLAYLYDEKDPLLQSILIKSKNARFVRFQKMCELLRKDYTFSLQDIVESTFGTKSFQALGQENIDYDFLKQTGIPLGRPHLADVLIKFGYFKNRDECFSNVLNAESKYYVSYNPPNILEVIKAVKNAGGFCVLAHPFSKKRGKELCFKDIKELKNTGLDGLEVNHYEHDLKDREKASSICIKLSLLQLGSSDYHGTGKPNRLGENTTDFKSILKMEKETFRKVKWGWNK